MGWCALYTSSKRFICHCPQFIERTFKERKEKTLDLTKFVSLSARHSLLELEYALFCLGIKLSLKNGQTIYIVLNQYIKFELFDLNK